MFVFSQPYSFFLLIPVAVAAWCVYRRHRRSGLLFSAVRRVRRGATWRAWCATILPAFILAGLVLVVFALARPRTVLSRSRRHADVIAIEMVVDVSGSMEALDLSEKTPTGMKMRTRLDVVKETFAAFIEKRPDDLVGLVTFGGYAVTRAPLTLDHAALLHVLKGVEIPSPTFDDDGRIIDREELLTAIGDALATGCARLKDSEAKSRIIVLLSDGESNTGEIDPEQATVVARKMGIKVYTIGIGSTGRAPFRSRDMFGRSTVSYQGVSLDEKLLRHIATETGGTYFNVRNRDGLEEALNDIDQLERTRVETEVRYHYRELFNRFLAPGIGLLALASIAGILVTRRIV